MSSQLGEQSMLHGVSIITKELGNLEQRHQLNKLSQRSNSVTTPLVNGYAPLRRSGSNKTEHMQQWLALPHLPGGYR